MYGYSQDVCVEAILTGHKYPHTYTAKYGTYTTKTSIDILKTQIQQVVIWCHYHDLLCIAWTHHLVV